MIRPELFYNMLNDMGINFYSGVPDSLLKDLCAYITDHSSPMDHIIAANEGGAIGLAAGYYLSTGKIPVVYMQNSGIGNTINPLLSLMDKEVYQMPVLLIIGWRGEPGVHDEPQHIKQGKTTDGLLDAMNIRHEILTDEKNALSFQLNRVVSEVRKKQEPFALIVKKGTFAKYILHNTAIDSYPLKREEAIKQVASLIDDNSVVVSSTGMISRELFEYRESSGQGHQHDFLTVGSMGHASQIALGIAIRKPEKKVFCFDGDGAAIMHMGALGIIGSLAPNNFYHIIFNNGAHDSVGGQPTIGHVIDFSGVAMACKYRTVLKADTLSELERIVNELTKYETPLFLEINVCKGARADLGRPTTTPQQNKEALMNYLSK